MRTKNSSNKFRPTGVGIPVPVKALAIFTVCTVCGLFFSVGLWAEAIDTSKPYVASVHSSENALGLEDEIGITVINAGQLLDDAKQQDKHILLFIDSMQLKGIYPDTYSIDRDKGELHFFVDHSEEPIALWDHLMLSRESRNFFSRKVSISVGLEDQDPVPTLVKDKNSFKLLMVRKRWFYISVFALLVLLGLFIFLVIETDMLRDIGPNPPHGGRKPYSLAKTQMAIWLFTIMSSWLLLYVLKHSFDTINESLVILMGISSGAGLGAMTIDSNKNVKAAVIRSQGFIKDILSDSNGISFHRFQVFAWTIVMVLVFIRQVASYLVMPEFSGALLTLMGISSGTYLGFKVSEKPEPGESGAAETPPVSSPAAPETKGA
jgi:hypothetical protein